MSTKEQKERLKREMALRQCKVKLNILDVFLDTYLDSQVDVLHTHLEACEPCLKEVEEILLELEFLDNSEDNQSKLDIELTNFTKQYSLVISRAKSHLQKPTSTPVSSMLNGSLNVGSSIRLPALNLPSFSGAYEAWAEFRDTFTFLVHNNLTLSNVQKFHYLKSCLKNDAAKVIHSVEATDSNYDVAWDLLKKRYENLRLTVSGHINAIINIPMIPRENASALRNLTDTLIRNVRCLGALKLPVEHWDAILINIVTSKLDPTTKRDWESMHSINKLPIFDELVNFLNERGNLLESLQNKSNDMNTKRAIETNRREKINSFATTDSVKYKCFICEKNHSVFQCEDFVKLSAEQRSELVKRKNLCFNCLRSGHTAQYCKSRTCQRCNKRHHTLLHNTDSVFSTECASISCASQNGIVGVNQVLLSTACVKVRDMSENNFVLRALLDNGSQSNFITKKACDILNLKRRKIQSIVNSLGAIETAIDSEVTLTIRSIYSNYQQVIHCLVIDKITEKIPAMTFDAENVDLPEGIQLADVEFYESRKIDLLLGCSVFWSVLQNHQIRLGKTMPTLQQTKLGYILGGTIPAMKPESRTHTLCALSEQLTRFWNQEEVETVILDSNSDIECQRIFRETTKRNDDGRFIVDIPFRENVSELGESRSMALRRFSNLEKRLTRDSNLSQQYKEFIHEYRDLGHMSQMDETETKRECYYLPHHAVIKESSKTTKLRTVFDGSAATSSGLSLNDVQLKGPIVQSELFDILLRFRKHKYVFNADVEKMYRQILINPSQRKYQRILWRDNENDVIKCFELNTITYGLTSSPFLATRCLQQLSVDYETDLPEACKIIQNDFYVDDLLSGANTVDEARRLKKEITQILETARFNLRKWVSNSEEILDSSESEMTTFKTLNLSNSDSNRTLGLLWKPGEDYLHYSVTPSKQKTNMTKREVLSMISAIFDPLNLLGPIHIRAKLFMQSLWRHNLDWDDVLEGDLFKKWSGYMSDMQTMPEVQIPRQVLVTQPSRIELHGFCDASLKAFAACLYVKSWNADSSCVRLLCAKSRVAPLRIVSLPRLELCGAVLLAKLMNRVRKSLDLTVYGCYYWCDSTIVLHWINGESRKWKTYVANRVAEIQTLTDTKMWNHVSSHENAADILTRGCTVEYLINCDLWWQGPKWLSSDVSNSTVDDFDDIYDENLKTELRHDKEICLAAVENDKFRIFSLFSSFTRLRRVMTYILRFINNARSPNKKRSGWLTIEEIRTATTILVRMCQREAFENEIKMIRKGEMPKNLIALRPFLDKDDVLRVGGRLKNAKLDFDAIHQILLPKNHLLTDLIATELHLNNLHCGSQLLLSSLRHRYWPISGRNLTKRIIRNCVKCFKVKPKPLEPLMGDLPSERVNQSFAFEHVGIDYGGPFLINDKRTRGCKQIKAYICVFVCFSTRAVHLELATDLSSNCFIAVLRRFIARRGKPRVIFSDNATNFIGTRNRLKQVVKYNDSDKLDNFLIVEEIQWKTIPPRSPHFGGLWESAIKSVKYHLIRVAGNSHLVYEEFYTILTQIEAILNSRPISPLSSDPHDLSPLTPGHFLIGRPLTGIPEENLTSLNPNRLIRYQRVQQIVQHFWNRWQREYLGELQARKKWNRSSSANIKEGDLVVIQEDNLPPCRWLMGRVQKLIVGSDNVARVAELKTSDSVIKRALRRLCLLPIEN